MRTLAFYFAAEDAAEAAIETMRSVNGLGDADIRSAPLVVEGDEGTVVALSVNGDSASRVEGIASDNGGRLVADVPEEWL